MLVLTMVRLIHVWMNLPCQSKFGSKCKQPDVASLGCSCILCCHAVDGVDKGGEVLVSFEAGCLILVLFLLSMVLEDFAR